MSDVYYNENDPSAAAWLRELIKEGHLPDGDVDERDIRNVAANDVRGYRACHWFAGIGGWPYALRLAGRDGLACWTGSCPCQPFSSAGKRKGAADERHLWPDWFRLISECQPELVFGEQVEAAIRHGWLDLVFTDLEAEDYACGATILGAHSVQAPHIRQRLFWGGYHHERWRKSLSRREESGIDNEPDKRMADSQSGQQRRARQSGSRNGREQLPAGRHGGDGGVVHTSDGRQAIEKQGEGARRSSDPSRLADTGRERSDSRSGSRRELDSGQRSEPGIDDQHGSGMGNASSKRCGETRPTIVDSEPTNMPPGAGWADVEYIQCRDGKARPVKPGVRLLAHGVPGRVAQLRGLGNAIVPSLAATFVTAFMESIE